MKRVAIVVACAVLAITSLAQTGRPAQTFQTSAGTVKITPIYHASLSIEAGGKLIYLDPAKPANVSGMTPADLILLTDIHPDHLDTGLITSLSKPGTEIWGPSASAKTIANLKVISNGETKNWNDWSIEAVPMYNLVRGPAPGKLYHDKGRGNGYILTYGGKRFYFSGDTEVTPEMRALKNIDVAFVCMNLPYTMPPEEAAEGIKAFHPQVVIPYHDRGSNLGVLEKRLRGTGIEVRLLDWYPK
jgi:L-ascorbate metabolism protein UlaG (beta-lactamase superfamily)